MRCVPPVGLHYEDEDVFSSVIKCGGAQVTEDFLEEYGWKRLYRQIGELGKSETVMTTQSHDLRENARVVRERLERNRCARALNTFQHPYTHQYTQR